MPVSLHRLSGSDGQAAAGAALRLSNPGRLSGANYEQPSIICA